MMFTECSSFFCKWHTVIYCSCFSDSFKYSVFGVCFLYFLEVWKNTLVPSFSKAYLFLCHTFPLSLSPSVSLSVSLSPSLLFLCIYLPSSNVKRLWGEARLPWADCVAELMISSHTANLWSSPEFTLWYGAFTIAGETVSNPTTSSTFSSLSLFTDQLAVKCLFSFILIFN